VDSIDIDLRGTEISGIELDQGQLLIHFARAYLIKTLTGSAETTRWWQTGSLVIDGVEQVPTIPPGSLVCLGGDLEDNIYTYRDMIPVPLESRGRIRCALRFAENAVQLVAEGTGIRLRLAGSPKYIEHLRASSHSQN
jgi:hypothetical protein